MLRSVRTDWLFPLVIAAYVCLDFCSPFVPGAFVFDADQSVDGVVRQDPGADDGALPVMVPSPNAARVVEVSLAWPLQPRTFPSVEWVVVLREAHARSSGRSSLGDAH